MATYKITSKSANKCLNIYGNNVTSLYNNQNVCLWADSGTNEQKWEISSLGSGVYIKSTINTAFGLNVYRSGSPWNCDVYPISGNETDAKVNIISAGSGYYKIQLANYTGYYLTAGGTGDGSNVYWTTATGGDNQLWKFTSIPNPGTTSKTLTMPVNRNQKYSGNPSWIQSYGCAVACVADVASYFDSSRNYTIQDMINCGAGVEGVGVYWGNVPKAKFTSYTSGSYLAKIKSEIDGNRPVLVHCKNNSGNEHWVVAYKYINSAASTSDITVLDPAGSSSSTVGAIRTLSASMSYNYNLTYINDLKLTSAK